MMLFASEQQLDCHVVRFVMAEKSIDDEFQLVNPDERAEDLQDLNPYSSVPTLLDRDLVLYDLRVIVEYLDERFPHPTLMPTDPISRAQTRLMLFRVLHDWFSLAPDLNGKSDRKLSKARKLLSERLTSTAPVFSAMPYFMDERFSIVDCCIGALLWRLPHWGVKLPESAGPVHDYAQKIFAREAFQRSLSPIEKEMRPWT